MKIIKNLDTLMKGFSKTTLCKKSFYEMNSPVPCSSNVMFSLDHPDIIKKTKKQGKRTSHPIKLVWEFLQYEILHRLFELYKEETKTENLPKPKIAEPIAVFPEEYSLYLEFIPGFILQTIKDRKDITAQDINGIETKIEYVAAFNLGYINKIKEIEGIYHSDYDLRHVIVDAESSLISIIDLENLRYTSNKSIVKKESQQIKELWFKSADKKGFNIDALEMAYSYGEQIVNLKSNFCLYLEILKDVEKEYNLKIKPSKGIINRIDVGLKPVKNER